jgi:hypothetical protein
MALLGLSLRKAALQTSAQPLRCRAIDVPGPGRGESKQVAMATLAPTQFQRDGAP